MPEVGSQTVISGASGPAIVVGAAAGGSIIIGSDLLTNPPMVAFLDGVTAHITIDGLGAVAYGQTTDTHQILLVRAVDPTDFHYWTTAGSSTAQFHSLINSVGTASLEGHTRAVRFAGVGLATSTANSQCADGGWHLLQGAGQYTGPNATVYLQTDGMTRESAGTYARVAGTCDKVTIGARRHSSGPSVIDEIVPGHVGYFALITGVQLSQGDMDVIWAAFDTGGGRSNTRRITEAIQSVLGAGTLEWAGGLDGKLPHVNTAGAAAPIYVDAVLERAGPVGFHSPLYAYMPTGSYIRASDADATAINTIIKSTDDPLTVLCVMGSDPELGAAQELFSASTNVDSNGSLWRVRNVTSKPAFEVFDDDAGVLRFALHTDVIFDGRLNHVMHVETAVASAAQTKGSVNGAAFVNYGATWLRSSLGQLDWFSYSGGIRGVVPDNINAEFGHCYFRCVVDEDLTSDRVAIWDAFNDALAGDFINMPQAIAAMLAAIETAVTVPATNIIYAEEYTQDSVASYGDTAIKVGVTFTAAGVTP